MNQSTWVLCPECHSAHTDAIEQIGYGHNGYPVQKVIMQCDGCGHTFRAAIAYAPMAYVLEDGSMSMILDIDAEGSAIDALAGMDWPE